MIRLNVILLAAVLVSAVYLVQLQYQSRTIYTAVDAEQVQARKLNNEREVLDVQKRAQAAALHTERTAISRLGMRETSPAITHYVQQREGRITTSGPATASDRVPVSTTRSSSTSRINP